MGRSYTVPRSAKGEGRILYIFSVKSLIATIIGGVLGVPFFLFFSAIEMTFIGFICIGLLAVIGYMIEVLVIPDSPLFGNLRKAGGEKVRDILIRTIIFMKNKKIYLYRPKIENSSKNIKNDEKTLDGDNTENSENTDKEEVNI